MKRTLKTLAALSLVLGLAACSTGGGTDTPSDTAENTVNPHHYHIVPIEAGQLPLTLPDVKAAVINGNYALEAKLNETNPALKIESFDAETSVKRTNYVAVKQGNEDSDKTKALVAAITSPEVKA
jgi:D-methionine transport system substrate-binding protein